MLRRTILAAVAGALAFGIGVPAATAAPPLSQTGYAPLGDDTEWPDYTTKVEHLAGPAVEGLEPAASGFSVSALTADTCDVVLPDPTIDLVKTAERTQLSPTQMRLRVQLDTTQTGGDFRLRDCIWIDDGDGVWEEATETLFGIDLEPVVWVADTSDNIGSFARFRVNLPVAADQAVCDRAARSELEGDPVVPLLRSNTLCLPGLPDPVVPEAAMVALLPMTAAALGAGCWLLLRRRRPLATV
jgi:hypothetical protein